LAEALEQGFDLAAPVASDFFEMDMPYYTPLTFNDVAEQMMKKHQGQCWQDIPVRPYAFLVRKKSLESLPDATLLYDLPKHLTSTFVPASIVHRFGDSYISPRKDIMSFIPYGTKQVLDVGCAKGLLGAAIKQKFACTVFGIELNDDMAKEARTRLDEVFCTDIEQAVLPFDNALDVVIFGDILEHLMDPGLVLQNAKKWLKHDGIIIASIPNTAHYSVIMDLLRGRWDYIPWGLLCVTHLRFFTRSTILEIFRKSGYSVITMAPQAWPVHLREKLKQMLSAYLNVENLGQGIFIPGYYVVAQKNTYREVS
jgi:2-polyprenyl-3-methyl-5-hydroxy-6-metoxy-1,4-benzoquinol methylase